MKDFLTFVAAFLLNLAACCHQHCACGLLPLASLPSAGVSWLGFIFVNVGLGT